MTVKRVVIAGQMPPPIGGQNINIKRLHDLLAAEEGLDVSHLNFQFTPKWHGVRSVGVSKLIEIVKVWYRALKIRNGGKIDFLLFPAGGPHTVAIYRDILLIPFLSLLTKRLVVHFRAAGLAEKMEASSSFLRWICSMIYGNLADEAVVLLGYGERDAKAVGIDKITVIPNAYENRVRDWSRGGNVEAGYTTFLSVGHICKDKGTPQLIEAFGRMAKENPNIRLNLVGETLPPYSQKSLEDDIMATGCSSQINLLGVLEGAELDRQYKEADLFVFASVAPYESFGMVLIEAMHWSLPIAVTDWRGNVSVCGDGFGGVKIRSEQQTLSKSLEEGLKSALMKRSLWGAWGERNRLTYEECYQIDHLRANFVDLIMNMEGDDA
jgi:glycosyltransferase involved in cell wall biosynthesis